MNFMLRLLMLNFSALEYFSAHDVALVKGHFMISTSREAKRFTHLHMCNFIIANIAGNLDYV